MRFYRLIGSVTRNGETLPWISLGMFTNEASAQRAADWTAGLTGLPPGTEWQPWPDGRVARSWSSDDMRVSQVIAPFDTGTPASKPTRASMPQCPQRDPERSDAEGRQAAVYRAVGSVFDSPSHAQQIS
jgi:hypothetical protein